MIGAVGLVSMSSADADGTRGDGTRSANASLACSKLLFHQAVIGICGARDWSPGFWFDLADWLISLVRLNNFDLL